MTTAETFATSAVNTASSAITASALTLNTSSPLTGGPITFNPGTNASLTLGLNTNALDASLNNTYAQLGAKNTFTVPQNLSGGEFAGALKGVSTQPGQTALTRMLSGASSSANAIEKAITAPFEVE